MMKNTYLSIITLNVKWAKYANQKTQGERMDKKNKTHLYPAYKRFILDLKTPAG